VTLLIRGPTLSSSRPSTGQRSGAVD
jgi:hypothetical protein